MTHVTANFVQQQFRGRNDDGSQTAATWKAATNTNWTQSVGVPFRIRFSIQETAGASATKTLVVQHNRNSTGWVTTTTSSANVTLVASASVSDGTATTQQISSGSFVVGSFDSNGSVSSVTLISQFTEMEYCLQLSGSTIVNGDTLQFRVVDNGTALNGYTATPTVTADKPTAIEVAVTGSAGTAAVGAATTIGRANVSPTGISGTGGVGAATIAGRASTPVAGVSATGSSGVAGTLTVIPVNVAGVNSTGVSGSAIVNADGVAVTTGVSATGTVGSTTAGGVTA